mgnify:CR=1 FL=1
MPNLHVLTYNIHKGFPQFNRRVSLHELRDRLQSVEPDLVFLQEVVGFHARHAERHAEWPTSPQYEFLADQVARRCAPSCWWGWAARSQA